MRSERSFQRTQREIDTPLLRPISVLLQPMKEDPAPGAKCRDKFLVQSVVITPERETNSLPELVRPISAIPPPLPLKLAQCTDDTLRNATQWSIIEKEDKLTTKELAAIHEQKIRCTYLPAEDHDTIPEEAAEPSASAMNAGAVSATGSDGDVSRPFLFSSSRPPPSIVQHGTSY